MSSPGLGALAEPSGALTRFVRHRGAVGGAMLIGLLALAALLAPALTVQQPEVQDLVNRLQAPTRAHWLGTDGHGRDVLTRLLFGARVSLMVGLAAAALAVGVGVLIGAVAGYWGGRIDLVLMRFTDVFMTIPVLFLVLLVVAAYGASLTNTICVLGAVYWPGVARLVRGQLLSLRAREFVLAAMALGSGDARLVARHLLPNAAGVIVVQVT